MAIFYEYIKGCNPNNTAMTWIKWSTEASTNSDNEMYKSKHLPNIIVGEGAQNSWDLGRVITSDAIDQVINESFKFAKDIEVVEKIKSPTIEAEEIVNTPKLQCGIRTYIMNDEISFSEGSINAHSQGLTFQSLGMFNFNSNINVTGDVLSSGKCQAQYFNATSDARAKSNITPAQFSALDVIKQLPIYKFNYLNIEEPVIGLIAQEAAEHDLDGFNMVDNLDAAGEFGDYMQIKESKLVYVLWKAVQELTDEVNSLKAQIQQLENK